MSGLLSRHGTRRFARFLVAYLCIALAGPVSPALAAPGDILDNSGFIANNGLIYPLRPNPINQAFFAFEVESPFGTLKEVPTWDEIEHVLDNPYQFELDPVDITVYPGGFGPTMMDGARPAVNPANGALVSAGTGNDQGWPAYRLTTTRRRAVLYRLAPDNVVPCDPRTLGCNELLPSFVFHNAGADGVLGNADDNSCRPGTLGCVEVPLPKHLYHPLNYNYQGGEELRLLNPEYVGSVLALQDFWVPGDLVLQDPVTDPPVPPDFEAVCTDTDTGLPLPVYRYAQHFIDVSPGSGPDGRLEDDEAAIDYNSPIQSNFVTFATATNPTGEVCVRTLEFIFLPGPGPGMGGEFGIVQQTIPEGVCLCGGDPGEPGYEGFGQLVDLETQYSTPTVPGKTGPGYILNAVTGAWDPDPANFLAPDPSTDTDILFDPARGYIYPRDPDTGYGQPVPGALPDFTLAFNTLRKPSLRVPLEDCDPASIGHDRCGTPIAPNYLWNAEDALRDRAFAAAIADGATDNAAQLEAAEKFPAFLAPSNENDYFQNRDAATVLGKAIFWDQQLGSDSVQACASCHFHAGADNRTKNQLNPNHLSNDFTFQLKGPNQEVVPADFPFHKLADPEIAGDPACVLPLVTPFGQVVCDASNVESDTNDVMSSMGVFFGTFGDIPPIGTFNPADNTGVRSLPPDVRTSTPLTWRQQIDAAMTLSRTDLGGLNAGNLDPIPAFQGVRRVEPRNTPTIFAASMNFDNFWDGRARHDFNGGSVFGPSDPQAHVWVFDSADNTLVPTRQIIRFTSLASLFTGPALSAFEMSQTGRNWAKIGKKLLQPGVTPLANQLVDRTDSVLGPYSNQGGSWCVANGRSTTGATGKPGLCLSYNELIQMAYYPALWQNDNTQHLNGSTAGCAHPMVNGERDPSDPPNCDPFDGYVLALDNGAVNPLDTNQFTQMEANVPLFFGLAFQAWGNILIPDDSPMDRFFDLNPDSFKTFGEAAEPFLVLDLPMCTDVGVQSCFTEVGNFKRDPNVTARVNCGDENCTPAGGGVTVPAGGTRLATEPDPLLGLDFFLGSNLSLKNPRFKTLRCGECHAGGTLTDHTFEISHQMTFGDWIPEFVAVGLELFPEPLTRGRLAHPFALEGELQENAQDGIERNIADFELDEFGFPKGQALFDNGMYNIGVRPIHEDVGRGGPDAFGFPLSLSYLAFKNLGGVAYTPGGDDPAEDFAQPPYPGNPLPNWEPQAWVLDNTGRAMGLMADNTPCLPTGPNDETCVPIPNFNAQTGLQGDITGGGLLEPTGQDFQINPGFAEEPADPQLPLYLAKWASNINVGDESQIDEVFVGLNTLLREPHLEGFVDSWGPFNPGATISEVNNNARQIEMGTWPVVNRVNTQGSFKAPPLRNSELTGPYFHTGSKLTFRQELDFYDRGGDFPISNSPHRDFLLMHLDAEDEALGGWLDPVTGIPAPRGTALCPSGQPCVPEFTEEQKEAIKVAMIDFLLELTDERVKFERAPFDHPEVIVPLDGTAPENHGGRASMANDPRFRVVPAVGAAGNADNNALPNFLNVVSRPVIIVGADTYNRCTPKTDGINAGINAVPVYPGASQIAQFIPQCPDNVATHYSSDTTGAVLVASLNPVGTANTGTTATATAVAAAPTSGAATGSTQTQLLARNTGITYVAPTVSAATELTLKADPAGAQTVGTTVTLTAAASGGSRTYQYRFWLWDGADWTILQDYGQAATCKWTPAEAGTYTVEVHARSAGSTADYEVWTRSEYVID